MPVGVPIGPPGSYQQPSFEMNKFKDAFRSMITDAKTQAESEAANRMKENMKQGAKNAL